MAGHGPGNFRNIPANFDRNKIDCGAGKSFFMAEKPVFIAPIPLIVTPVPRSVPELWAKFAWLAKSVRSKRANQGVFRINALARPTFGRENRAGTIFANIGFG